MDLIPDFDLLANIKNELIQEDQVSNQNSYDLMKVQMQLVKMNNGPR
jgi:hypothetical protein